MSSIKPRIIRSKPRRIRRKLRVIRKSEQKTPDIRDLSNLTSVLVEKIFSDLSVKEISKLCESNKKFNEICKSESLWKDKVWNDYGVDKKYGKTWRETARRMSITNMINLNGKWINGQTYKELLEASLPLNHFVSILQEDLIIDVIISTVEDLQEEYQEKYGEEYPYEREDIAMSFLGTSQSVEDIIEESEWGINFSDEDKRKLSYITNREMKIIAAVSLSMRSSRSFLPGTVGYQHDLTRDFIINFDNEGDFSFFRYLVDYIPYVMQYSTFPDQPLK